jgi:hypothetical protein
MAWFQERSIAIFAFPAQRRGGSAERRRRRELVQGQPIRQGLNKKKYLKTQPQEAMSGHFDHSRPRLERCYDRRVFH